MSRAHSERRAPIPHPAHENRGRESGLCLFLFPVYIYIHGLAGDLAAQIHGTYGMVASDIVDNLGKAIIEVMK